MKNFVSASVILNIVLLVIILMLRECTPPCTECPEVDSKDSIITKVDTVFLAGDTILNPEPYAVLDIIRDTVFRTNSDTIYIVKDYQLIRSYHLPAINDSNGKIDVNVNVQFNKIASWSVSGQLFNRVIDHHHYIRELPQLKFFIGIQTGIIMPDKVIAAPSGVLLTKKGHLYLAGYDPFNKAALIGLYFKLGRKD